MFSTVLTVIITLLILFNLNLTIQIIVSVVVHTAVFAGGALVLGLAVNFLGFTPQATMLFGFIGGAIAIIWFLMPEKAEDPKQDRKF
jgi:uncharacterized membrane protein YgaE (UPF0421/DUF939 family)